MRTGPIVTLQDASGVAPGGATFDHRGDHDLYWVSAEARTAFGGWVAGLVQVTDTAGEVFTPSGILSGITLPFVRLGPDAMEISYMSAMMEGASHSRFLAAVEELGGGDKWLMPYGKMYEEIENSRLLTL